MGRHASLAFAIALSLFAGGCAGATPAPRDPSASGASMTTPNSDADAKARADGATAANAGSAEMPEPTPPGCKALPGVADSPAAADYAAQMSAARAIVKAAAAIDLGDPPSADAERATWVKSCLGAWFRARTHAMQLADAHFADAARATHLTSEQAVAAAEAAEAWTATLEALLANGERGEPASWKSDPPMHDRFRAALHEQTNAWSKQHAEPPFAECMHLTAAPDQAQLRATCYAIGQRQRALR